ncbi:glycoside hydrolase family 127 protein [Paracidobacterium acidisoli]|uniref:Glycoside hydrolase family 127 protein n=1 Tax=Paracidobacterium acidisoli TaxID=2303751 RepID=A0A372ILG3_9BACT|nr:beta-L-arabinofuranosidase domain-containing protein [Paracidobacterium acidisoli]MBT9332369.1 glycoside hydrolase family 127 protein [Paracidobacterium acidisoli]
MKKTETMSRRTFLSAAAGTAAASLFTTAHAGALYSSMAQAGNADPQYPWKDKGVIDLSHSPYAKLKGVPVAAVTIQEGFWSKRRQTNVQDSIPSMYDELIAHGRMDNFLRLEGRSDAPQKGPVYSDSDMYKWTEAVGFALQTQNLPALREKADTVIHEIVAAQEPGGYLNTYYVQDRSKLRMLPDTQTTGHELYNIGHLIQGSIAYYRATGDPTLLDAGIKFVDGFLLPNYGPGPNQKPIVAGHPEIEMSLIELYRTTGNHKYLELAGYILHGDTRIPLKERQIVYMFCGIPFTSRTKLEGHAVRAMYACCGATDYYLETGDASYLNTLTHLWEDLIEHQLYITGGVGARSEGEAFGDAYELPNARAYGESCAAIGNMMWNYRMLSATADARHADVMERALYNGINSGMSLNGRLYCYRNPLAFDPSTGDRIRNPWYDTTCCPPNLERTLASLPGYFYSTSSEGIYIHLYDNSELNWRLESGNAIRITQTTKYPWEGRVNLRVMPGQPEEFTIFLRIPSWSRASSVSVGGRQMGNIAPGRYLAIRRRWSGEENIELNLDMQPKLVRANPAVAEDTGRIAVQRGPVVFCMEQLDQADAKPDNFALFAARLSGETTAQYNADLLDGVVELTHAGVVNEQAASAALYQAAQTAGSGGQSMPLRLIPYYAWANREPSNMQVWIPYSRA